MNLLIKNGTVIDPGQNLNKKADLYVENGKIKEIGDISDYPGCEVYNAEGLYIVPGLIDMHVHLRDPGFTEKETIVSGAAAAAAGGFTSVVCMPNTKPAIDNLDTIAYINNEAQKTPVNLFMMGSITQELKGEKLNDYKTMKEHGIVGLTDDGMTVMDARVMYEALLRAGEENLLVSVHCEDKNLVYDNTFNKGIVLDLLKLEGRPNASEDIIVARDILLAQETGARIHIQHVSTSGSIDFIRYAKSKGMKVSCEVTPHHFTLNDSFVFDLDTNAKMSPPLRSSKDVEETLKGIEDGTIDVIASDHAPHTEADKKCGLIASANGIIGLETSLGLAVTHLVKTGKISFTRLIELMSTNPARLLGLNKGNLKMGQDADITIIDINKTWIVDKEKFKSKGRNTPFDGMELTGKAVATIVAGKIVYRE